LALVLDGGWTAFPNAKYLFSRIENDWGDPRHNPAIAGDLLRTHGYLDSVLPVIEAGQAELIEAPFSIDDTLLVEPAPGQTRGHVVLKLDVRNETAVFCGDAMHHPLQVYARH
jgi:glyoxylase-like metal-dependent hydrolase (beta-lactamase superfamily II)